MTGLQHDADDPSTKDESKFYPELLTTLRRLCHAHLHFEECVELVGLVCVETDRKTKDTYSIKELVKRGLLPRQRTHERHQAELEASEAESVAAVLSRFEGTGNNSGLSDSLHQPGDMDTHSEASADCHDTLSSRPGSPQASQPSRSASPQSSQGQGQLTNTGDGVGDSTETSQSSSVCRLESDAGGVICLSPNPYEEGAHCRRSDTVGPGHETTSAHSHSVPCHSYDETDHSGQPESMRHRDHHRDASTPVKNKVHTAPGPWQSLCRGDHCGSCKLGESHKVVVSDDGMVSHVVHNGPALGQVYRIDLSNHSGENEAEMDDELPPDTVKSREEVQMGDEESRDRAASMESTDSFMEVGIVSKINHAQRLLASPSPRTSPTSFPVSDQTPPPDPDPYPPRSPGHASAHATTAPDSTHLHAEAPPSHPSHLRAEAPPSHPTHNHAEALPSHSSQTSVIKEVFNPQHSAAVKSEPTSSSSSAFSTGEVTTASNDMSVDGDLPLDMSLVKDEIDNSADDADEHPRQSVW